MVIAIFQGQRVYEGDLYSLHVLHPLPTISKVVVDSPPQPELAFLGSVHFSIPPLFREDSFDPISRLRRGRFYGSPQQRQYEHQRVSHFPYPPPTGAVPPTFDVVAYEPLQPSKPIGSVHPVIRLGEAIFSTPWRVIGSERIFNGETLFTLKSVDSLGALTELNHSALPPDKAIQIEQAFDKVADAAHRDIPETVVDICREFARSILAAWLPTIGVSASGDLGELIKKVPADLPVVSSAAQILARFHSRGKSSEQERQADRGRPLRPLSLKDAELSLGLISCLLREFGWAV